MAHGSNTDTQVQELVTVDQIPNMCICTWGAHCGKGSVQPIVWVLKFRHAICPAKNEHG
jgi:hypothetical protein